MATSKSTLIGNHGGLIAPPPRRDGGDDHGHGFPNYGQRLRRARLGMFCATTSILILFLAFSVVLLVRHRTSTFDDGRSYTADWARIPLPTSLLVINSVILAASSGTIEMARRRIARDVALSPARSIPGISVGNETGLPWLGATVVLGIAFLVGQGMAWQKLFSSGFYLSSGPGSSFVYLFTAAHAIHLSGGILALLYCSVVYFFRRPVESRHIIVDVTAWYWHFMLFLWIYIFGLLEFAR